MTQVSFPDGAQQFSTPIYLHFYFIFKTLVKEKKKKI